MPCFVNLPCYGSAQFGKLVEAGFVLTRSGFLLLQLRNIVVCTEHPDRLALLIPDSHAAAVDPNRRAIPVGKADCLVVRVIGIFAVPGEVFAGDFKILGVDNILPSC